MAEKLGFTAPTTKLPVDADMEYNFIANAAPSYTASDDESILVKDIIVKSVGAGKLVQVWIGNRLAGEFAVATTIMGNHLAPPTAARKTLLGYLWEKGIFKGYPVPSGSKITLKTAAGDSLTGKIIYDSYDKEVIVSTMENGATSSRYMIVNYGQTAADVATATTTAINTQMNSPVFVKFPYGDAVPQNRKITVHGILASERAGDDGSTAANYALTTYLKFEDDRTTEFDEARNGVLLAGKVVAAGGTFEAQNDVGSYGDYTDLWTRPPKLYEGGGRVYTGGSKVALSWTTIVGGTPGTLLAAELQVAVIETIEIVAGT